MVGMSNNFLSRWSRRKLQASAPPVEDCGPEGQTPEREERALREPGEPPLTQAVEGDSEITPVELAALPAPEELTAASDITRFLRKGVPAALRNRALRRMWVIDPAVRDFVGDARDYAWDWNTPGGVPLSRPLPSTMDVEKMVQNIFDTDSEARTKQLDVAGQRKETPDSTAAPQRSAPAAAQAEEDAGTSGTRREEGSPARVAGPRRRGGALPS